jgi:hypothetical protein
VTAARVLCNTVYLELAKQALRKTDKQADDGMLEFTQGAVSKSMSVPMIFQLLRDLCSCQTRLF